MDESKFSGWGLCEIMGRQRIAGRLSEQTIAGSSLLRVDIPLSDAPDHFRTQFVGGGSIHSLHPTDEQTARLLAKRIGTEPVYQYDVQAQLRIEQRAAEPATTEPSVRVYSGDDPDADHDEDDGQDFEDGSSNIRF